MAVVEERTAVSSFHPRASAANLPSNPGPAVSASWDMLGSPVGVVGITIHFTSPSASRPPHPMPGASPSPLRPARHPRRPVRQVALVHRVVGELDRIVRLEPLLDVRHRP